MKSMLCTIALLSLSNFSPIQADVFAPQEIANPYSVKDFSYLLGMEGFSDATLKNHFKLYSGYVQNTNLLLSILESLSANGKDTTPIYAEIKRRLGWEFDGMRLHEDYFGNLGGKGTKLSESSALYKKLVQSFGSYEKWKQSFLATGSMRGIGWVVLYLDPITNRLLNIWVGEHDIGHLAGAKPILIMDVWEHAYMLDYGLNRANYMDAFFNNIDWNVVQKRYQQETIQENGLRN